jgi:hypothetical protein
VGSFVATFLQNVELYHHRATYSVRRRRRRFIVDAHHAEQTIAIEHFLAISAAVIACEGAVEANTRAGPYRSADTGTQYGRRRAIAGPVPEPHDRTKCYAATDSRSDWGSHGNAERATYARANADSNSDADCETDAHSDSITDRDALTDTDPDSDGRSDAYTDSRWLSRVASR